MVVDLKNHNDYWMKFPHISWANLLHIAQQYGWRPAGTVLGEGHPYADYLERWAGSYSSNDGQTVTAEDANAFADALEKALNDIPNHQIDSGEFIGAAELRELADRINYPIINSFADIAPEGTFPKEVLNPFEHLAGERKLAVKELIAFCREGAFRIF